MKLVHPLPSDCLFYRKTTMEAWAMEEFAEAALGDEQLNQRLVKLTTRVADKPTASISSASVVWSEKQVANRFFEQSSDKKRRLGWPISWRRTIPKAVPSMREVARQIAMLGGSTAENAMTSLAFKPSGWVFSVCETLLRGSSTCRKFVMSNELCGTVCI